MESVITPKQQTLTFDPNHPKVKKLIKQAQNPFLFKLFLLKDLPMAWFMGMRLKSVSPEKAVVTIPYGWRTKNPFRSIYFIAQAGAAEFPAGIMARIALQGRPPISMLVREVSCEFFKKANSRTTFTCEDGLLIQETVQRAIETGEGETCLITSVGKQENGEIVSVTKLTWSFKVKSKK